MNFIRLYIMIIVVWAVIMVYIFSFLLVFFLTFGVITLFLTYAILKRDSNHHIGNSFLFFLLVFNLKMFIAILDSYIVIMIPSTTDLFHHILLFLRAATSPFLLYFSYKLVAKIFNITQTQLGIIFKRVYLVLFTVIILSVPLFIATNSMDSRLYSIFSYIAEAFFYCAIIYILYLSLVKKTDRSLNRIEYFLVLFFRLSVFAIPLFLIEDLLLSKIVKNTFLSFIEGTAIFSSIYYFVLNSSLLTIYFKVISNTSKSDKTVSNKFIKNYSISVREAEIIRLLVLGKENKQIAEELFISPDTVRNHLYKIFRKTNVSNRGELAHLATNYSE